MKKKKSIQFPVKDLFVVLICLAGSAGALYLFNRDINTSQLRSDQKVVAYVTYKNKAVQRRFENRVYWDRVQQKSSLYNGDVVRTAPASQASIEFLSGSVINMGEVTLIQVFDSADGVQVAFDQGSLVVDSTGKTTVKSGKNSVTFEKGTSAAVNITKPATVGNAGTLVQPDSLPQLQISSIEGVVLVQNNDGVTSVAKGESLGATIEGKNQINPSLAVVEPQSFLRALTTGRGQARVRFAWNTMHSDGTESARIEFYRDKTFHSLFLTQDVQRAADLHTTVLLPEGYFYWRLFLLHNKNGAATGTETASTLCASGAISVLSPIPVEQILPGNGEHLIYSAKKEPVYFSWKPDELAASYTLRLFNTAQVDRPAAEYTTAEPFLSVSSLSAGQWYWTVQPIYAASVQGVAAVPAGRTFLLTENPPLSEPVSPAVFESPVVAHASQETVNLIASVAVVPFVAGTENLFELEFVSVPSSIPESPIPTYLRDEQKTVVVQAVPQKAAVAAPIEQKPKKLPAPNPSPVPVAKTVKPAAVVKQAEVKQAEVTQRAPIKISAPQLLSPLDGQVFDTAQIQNGKIRFVWNAVENSESYVFTIYNDKNILLYEKKLSETVLVLSDLKVLDRGTFYWAVQASAHDPLTPLSRVTAQSTGTFSIELPVLATETFTYVPVVYDEIPGEVTFISSERIDYTGQERIQYEAEPETKFTIESQKPVYSQAVTPVFSGEIQPHFTSEYGLNDTSGESVKYSAPDVGIKYADEEKKEFFIQEDNYVR